MDMDVPILDFGARHRLISWLRDIDIPGVRLISRLLPRVILPAPDRAVRLRTIHGFDLYVDPVADRGVERSLYETGTYEKGTLHIMHHLLDRGAVCVDVGANIGLMSVAMSRMIGPDGIVYAIEPNPEARSILVHNVDINGVKNIAVIPFAIGSSVSRAVIYDGLEGNRGRASLVAFGGDRIDEVEVRPLGDVLPEGTELDLVKIDVEGFELEVLRGMGSFVNGRRAPILVVEFSQERGAGSIDGSRSLYEHLLSIGRYRLFHGRAGKERISRLVEISSASELPLHDNVFCLTQEHIAKAMSIGILR